MMMITAASKRSRKANISAAKRLLGATETRDVTTRRVVDRVGAGGREAELLRMQDISGGHRGGVGIIRLNREHRYNMLTPNFTRQVTRSVESMNLDHSVSLVYLAPVKGQHFSNGTDFRTMLHYKAEGAQEKLARYLEDIFKLQATFAKTNKPIMTVAPGHSFNSGASLVAASGFPSICRDSKLAFNECTFGFVPHAGSTYYTSRLPGDFGTFLALTGVPITGKDSIQLGVSDALIEVPSTYEHEIVDVMTALDPTSLPTARQARGADGPAAIGQHRQVDEAVFDRMEHINRNLRGDLSELQKRTGYYHHDEPFVDPRDRKPDVVAEADLEYEAILRRYDQSRNKPAGLGYFDHDATTYNSFDYVHKWLRLHAGHEYSEDAVKTLLQHKEMIDRCFWPNSVEEIMDNLRREAHPFAKEILQKMESNSMLSMKLALKMLRKAQNMAYGEILKMELNVALNKVGDADFELGVREILMKPSKTSRFGARPNPGFQKDVSEALVDSYFEENKWASAIDLDIVENSLLPTRHFFGRFVDSVRVWINETSTPQEAVRDAVELEIQEALRAEGIDLRNKTVTVPMARDYLNRKVRAERRDEELMRRALQMSTDKTLRRRYFESIDKEVQQLEQDPKAFYDLVNKNIHGIFEAAYLERLSNIHEKSKEAQSLEKRRMFIRLKKFLLKSRLLVYLGEETDRLAARVQSLPFKQLHLTERWDESHRDMEHPDIQQSVMWHLSKAVGKVALAPPEMVRSYLTDPEAAKSHQAYTFDKAELEKLRRDLLENPEKYEEILKREREPDDWQADTDPGRFWDGRRARAQTREYWHRLVNDGRCEKLDNWPMRVEYHSYKKWADGIQEKALDTLKFTVSRLLLDFKQDESLGNAVAEFTPKAKESKRRALERLLTMLNEESSEVLDVKDKAQAKSPSKSKPRALNEIRKDFNLLVDQDSELNQIFGSTKVVKGNKQIEALREELLNELLQLVETVLLEAENERGVALKKDLLEKRLQETLSPTNASKDKTAQLRIIDTFLAEEGSKRAIRQAIELVKPFFFSVCSERIELEATKLLEAFSAQESGALALEQYLFHRAHPGKLQGHRAYQDLVNHHVDRDRLQYLDQANPEKSTQFGYRQLLASLGSGLDSEDPSLSLAEKEDAVTERTREQMKVANDFVTWNSKREEAISKKVQQSREQALRVPFDESVQAGLWDRAAAESTVSAKDVDAIEILDKHMHEVRDWIRKHEHELASLLTEADWLRVYGEGVKDHGLDMDHLIWRAQSPERYREDLEEAGSHLSRLQAEFGGDGSLTWESLADYANYVRGLHTARDNVASATDAQENYEKMIEFMTGYDSSPRTSKSKKTDLSRESIFRAIAQSRYNPQTALGSRDVLRSELDDVAELQNVVEQQATVALECLRLAKFAPTEVQEQVEMVLDSKCKYLDLKGLRQYLERKDFGKAFEVKNFLDQQRLLRDMHAGTALQDFVTQYRDIKLDVVSLAEVQAMMAAAKPNGALQGDLVAQVESVLEHVEDQMKYVSHERRSQLTLGEFMARHHHLNASTMREYSSDLLRNQVEGALGRRETLAESIAAIDWELGGVRTHPASHLTTEEHGLEEQLFDASEGDGQRVHGVGPASQVSYHDGDSNQSQTISKSELAQKAVYREARRLTELTPEMTGLKNMYENTLLREYMAEDFDQQKVEGLIQAYTQARLKDCMLKQDFAVALRSSNAHIYLEMLRENVMAELKLSEPATVDEFAWAPLSEAIGSTAASQALTYDAESKYNLQHLNNEQAIGYDNLEARAADPTQNRNLAHESAFDKMLADFFLSKRGEYKKSNALYKDLEELFRLDGDARISADQPVHEADAHGAQTLGAQYHRQTRGKDDKPELLPYSFPALMELDIAVNKQLHDNKSALSAELRAMSDEVPTIPEYFDLMDVRKPADRYVRDKLRGILEEQFAARQKLEQHLSRSELVAYDQVLIKNLSHETLLVKLKRELYKDFNELEQSNQMVSHQLENERNERKQALKTRNAQPEFNRGVVNEDALYKQLAYAGSLQRKRQEEGPATAGSAERHAAFDGFDAFYQETLLEDAKRPARPINPDDFAPKTRVSVEGTTDRREGGFLDMAGRREQFLDEHQLYRENKLEQQERIELYYVLEQMFEASKQKTDLDSTDPLHEAHKHMQEYFSQPENTYFFEKNKIH